MGMFDHFPYTNFHELNLDWILQALKEIEKTMDQFVAINSLKYADPIQWNIVKQYEKNTIVIDPLTGTAYISVDPVPSGVALTNTDYWTVVFDLGSFVVRAAKNFTNRYEAATTLTATFPTTAGQWLVWGDTLYVANVNITAGDSYVVDGNITHITAEEVKNAIYQLISDNYNAIIDIIGSLEDLTTSTKDNIVAAINELVTADDNLQTAINNEAQARQNADDNLQTAINNEAQARQNADDDLQTAINNEAQARQDADGDLSDLTTEDKSNLVNAINEVNETGGGAIAKIGDLNNLTTTAKDNVVNAINELDEDIAQEVSNRGTADTNLQNQINQLTGGTWEHYTQANRFTNANSSVFPTFVGDCYINKDLGLMNISFIANTKVAQGKPLNGNTIVANMPFKMTPNQTIGVYEAAMMNMYRVSDGLIYFAHTGALFISDANGDVKMSIILENYGTAGINTIALMGQITIPIATWDIEGGNTTGVWEHYTQNTGINNADPTNFPTMVADCYINRRLGLMSLSFICNTNLVQGRAINGNQNLFTLPFTLKEGSYGYYEACILDMYNTVTKRNYWAHTGMIINVNSQGRPTVQAIMESFGTNGLNACAIVGNLVIPCAELLDD